MSTENGIRWAQYARMDAVDSVSHASWGYMSGKATGIVTGLFFAGELDAVDFFAFSNELRFMNFRAEERRIEGLPV